MHTEKTTLKKDAKEDKDWSEDVASKIVEFINKLKIRLTGPFKPTAKLLAYLPFIVLALVTLIVLLTIGIFRLVDVYLPQDTWLAHFILSAFYILIGTILWRKRF